MNCPYCGSVMSKEDRRCPRCDKRVITEEEYFQLWSERAEYEEKHNAFKSRVGLVFNILLPGLGSFVVSGKLSMFLLAMVLEVFTWVFFIGTCVRGNPAFVYLVLPAVTRIFTVFATKKEEKD